MIAFMGHFHLESKDYQIIKYKTKCDISVTSIVHEILSNKNCARTLELGLVKL